MSQPYGFTEARARCTLWSPYTYSHVASMIPVARPGLGSMACDAAMRLYYDPALFQKWDIDKSSAHILRESLHLLLHHKDRSKAYLGDNPTKHQRKCWDLAADVAVTQLMHEYRSSMNRHPLSIPPEWKTPDSLDLPKNESAEKYYELLIERESEDENEENEQEQGGQGGDGDPYNGTEKPQPGQGGGDGGSDGQPHEWDSPAESKSGIPEMDNVAQQMVERHVAEECERYERERGRGTVPGDLLRFASNKLRPAADPFREAQAAARYCISATIGHGDYTWRKLPRRCPPGALRTPAPFKPVPRIVVIVDSSGSMDQKDFALGLGAIERGLQGLPGGCLTVLSADTHIRSVQKVFKADALRLSGGGGTSMATAIQQAAKMRPEPDAIIVVTDGETDWPEHELRQRVVVALTREESCPVPGWIRKVCLYVER